jgi:hypothetical protein
MISIKRNIRLVSRKLSVFAVAVTLISELSLKRLAVSFTTAKASGRISSNVFSEQIVGFFF